MTQPGVVRTSSCSDPMIARCSAGAAIAGARDGCVIVRGVGAGTGLTRGGDDLLVARGGRRAAGGRDAAVHGVAGECALVCGGCDARVGAPICGARARHSALGNAVRLGGGRRGATGDGWVGVVSLDISQRA